MPTQGPGRDSVALVTGANKGIGFEIARGLAEKGLRVLIGCRDPDRGRDAAAALRREGGQVDAVQLDITDDASIAAAAAWIDATFGRLDVLVNNAGINIDGRSPAATLRATMTATYATNAIGLACMIEAFVPLLLRSDVPRIVNMSSGLGSLAHAADPDYEFAAFKLPAYNSSKAAATMLTLVYAARLRDHGIKVNAADPGFCATDINDHKGYRTAAQGASAAIRLATLDADGPTGGFFDEDGPVPW